MTPTDRPSPRSRPSSRPRSRPANAPLPPHFDTLVDDARHAHRWRTFETDARPEAKPELRPEHRPDYRPEPKPGQSSDSSTSSPLDAAPPFTPAQPHTAERALWNALRDMPRWHLIVLVPPGPAEATVHAGHAEAHSADGEGFPALARPNLVAWPVQPAAGVFTDADRARAYAIEHGLLAAHAGPTPVGWGALNRGVHLLARPPRVVTDFLRARLPGRGGVVFNPGSHAFAAPLELVESLLHSADAPVDQAHKQQAEALPETVVRAKALGPMARPASKKTATKKATTKKSTTKKAVTKKTTTKKAITKKATTKAAIPKTAASKPRTTEKAVSKKRPAKKPAAANAAKTPPPAR